MTSKGLQVLLIRSYDRFRFFVGSKLDSTAGAHQPTFLSLRDPAKALHQRAPKARVGRGHYIILPQCNRKKYHCEQRFSPAAARMIYYFIFLIIWGGGAQHSQRSSTPPTFIKFLVGIVSKVSIFSIASIVRHPLPFFIKSLVQLAQLAQLIQLDTSAPPPFYQIIGILSIVSIFSIVRHHPHFIKVLVQLAQLVELDTHPFIKLLVQFTEVQLAQFPQLDTPLPFNQTIVQLEYLAWLDQLDPPPPPPFLLNYCYGQHSQHSQHSQTPHPPFIKYWYSQHSQHSLPCQTPPHYIKVLVQLAQFEQLVQLNTPPLLSNYQYIQHKWHSLHSQHSQTSPLFLTNYWYSQHSQHGQNSQHSQTPPPFYGNYQYSQHNKHNQHYQHGQTPPPVFLTIQWYSQHSQHSQNSQHTLTLPPLFIKLLVQLVVQLVQLAQL